MKYALAVQRLACRSATRDYSPIRGERMRDRPMNETELERIRELVKISGEMIEAGSSSSFYFDDVAWLVGVVEELAEMLGVTE